MRSASRCTGALPDCASVTSRAIWASAVSAPTRVARTTRRPPALTVAPATSSPGCFSTGTDSPVSSDWSTALRALLDDAVGGDLLAGADDEAVADGELLDRDAALAAVGVEDRDVLGAELEQRLQRGAGAALGARLEVAAGEEERRSRRRRPRGRSRPRRRRRGRGSGRTRIRMPGMPASPRNSAYSDHSQAASTPSADQRVHRRGAVLEVRPRGAVERPRAPQDHAAWRAAAPATASCRTAARRIIDDQPAPAAPAARETISRRRSGAVSSVSVGAVGGRRRRAAPPGSRRPRPPRRAASGVDRGGVELDRRLLGRVVDRGGDAVELVELRSMRFAHEAHVMPVIGSSTCGGHRASSPPG